MLTSPISAAKMAPITGPTAWMADGRPHNFLGDPAIAHVVALAAATVRSVLKPWGRTPWAWREGRADAG